MRINARLYIVITLLLVVIFNISGVACAEVNIPDANVQSSEQVSPYAVKLAKEELRAEFYERALEIYQREMEHFKWYIISLIAIAGIFIGWLGITKKREITQVGKKVREELAKEAEKQKEISVLWNKGNEEYSAGDYETATKIWQEIYNKYRLESRPFFNNWGSSLLHWAEQETGRKKEQLLNQAIEKYLKAESYTEGIAAYNIACCYAIIDNKEDVRKWLETAKKTGRLLSWKRASTDTHLKKFAGENWFRKIWDQS